MLSPAASRPRTFLALVLSTLVALAGLVAVPSPPARAATSWGPVCPSAVALDPTATTALLGHVTPPDTAGQAPADALSQKVRSALLSADRYALGTQLAAAYALRPAGYVDLRYDTWGQRAPTTEAMGLAISTETGAYDEAAVGRSTAFARGVAIWLTRAVACRHRANTPGGWGNSWQSPYYAAQAGLAGWLLWPHLTQNDRAYVTRMVVEEADRLIGYVPRYYALADGTVLSPGDTKAEEDAWFATVLALAAAMMPNHPHRAAWMRENVWLKLASYAAPADLTDPTPVHGAPLATWLAGWNAYDNGTVVNHDRIHPDYMATVAWNLSDVMVDGLAGLATPRAAFAGFDRVYRAFESLHFDSPPYTAPGGTAYVPDSGDIYFPQGNDWGTQRVAHFAFADLEAAAFGPDQATAQAFAAAHLDRHLALQARTDDGRSFLAAGENRMSDPEQWTVEYLGRSWLMQWVLANRKTTVSDENLWTLGVAPRVAVGGTDPVVESHTVVPPTEVAPDDSLVTSQPVPSGSSVTTPSAVTPKLAAGGAPGNTEVDVTGDATALDGASVTAPQADVTSAQFSAGDTIHLAVTLAAAPSADDDVTIEWPIDTAGTSAPEHVVTARLHGGTVSADVVDVTDGRRTCTVTPVVTAATVVADVEPSCLGTPGALWANAAVQAVVGGHLVADAVAVAGCRIPLTAAAAVTDRPATIRGSDGLHVVRRSGPGLEDVVRTGSTWAKPVALGGNVKGGADLGAGAGVVTVAARGTDDAVWTRSRVGSAWGGRWVAWGGRSAADPAVVVHGDGTLTVYVTGTDHRIWRRYGTVWGPRTGWQRVGGVVSPGPAVAVSSAGDELVVMGTDSLYRTVCTTARCGRWQRIAGATTESPGVTAVGSTVHVVARGPDGQIYLDTLANGTWSGWRRTAPGTATSAPEDAAAAHAMDVVVSWPGAQTCVSTAVAGRWTVWSQVGG